MRPEPVRCTCGTLFGYVEVLPDGTRRLAIKHRDLYRTVSGGAVEGPCRKCGSIVRWPNDPKSIQKA